MEGNIEESMDNNACLVQFSKNVRLAYINLRINIVHSLTNLFQIYNYLLENVTSRQAVNTVLTIHTHQNYDHLPKILLTLYSSNQWHYIYIKSRFYLPSTPPTNGIIYYYQKRRKDHKSLLAETLTIRDILIQPSTTNI